MENFTHGTTSIDMAEVLGVRHCNVLRSIRSSGLPKSYVDDNFIPVTSIDRQGKELQIYEISVAGALYLMMAQTGSRAALFKISLISKLLNPSYEQKIYECSGVDSGGHIYVLKLANGLVKVGKTKNLGARLDTHFKNLGAASKIEDMHFTAPHTEYSDNEIKIIQKFSTPQVEVFEADFEEVVGFVESLPMTPPTEFDNEAKAKEANRSLMKMLQLVDLMLLNST